MKGGASADFESMWRKLPARGIYRKEPIATKPTNLWKPKKTHCKRGHPRTPENVYPSNLVCKLCNKLFTKKQKREH